MGRRRSDACLEGPGRCRSPRMRVSSAQLRRGSEEMVFGATSLAVHAAAAGPGGVEELALRCWNPLCWSRLCACRRRLRALCSVALGTRDCGVRMPAAVCAALGSLTRARQGGTWRRGGTLWWPWVCSTGAAGGVSRLGSGKSAEPPIFPPRRTAAPPTTGNHACDHGDRGAARVPAGAVLLARGRPECAAAAAAAPGIAKVLCSVTGCVLRAF
jgi:hypothetical protein